jgi:prevent-host-death family protein
VSEFDAANQRTVAKQCKKQSDGAAAMTSWPVRDAKAHFDEMFDACLTDGPQVLTRRGDPDAILVKASEWQHLQAATKPSLKDLLLSADTRTEFLVPARGPAQQRRTTLVPEAGQA